MQGNLLADAAKDPAAAFGHVMQIGKGRSIAGDVFSGIGEYMTDRPEI